MTNEEIAAVLEEIADLLEIDGADQFRVLSYRRGAEIIAVQGHELEAMVAEGGAKALQALPGIGKGLAQKVAELVETGELAYHQDLKSKFPPGLLEMLRVPGLGPKKVALVYRELGIGSVEELAQAAREQRLRDLPGLGAKSEENILRGLETFEQSVQRALLGDILPLAEGLVGWLREQPQIAAADYAGSTRRGCETVGDLDLLATSEQPAEVCQAFAESGELEEIIAAGETKVSGRLPGGPQVDLRVVPPESYGAALQYFTGSQAHNITLRTRAQRQGLTVNEYGVFEYKNEQAGKKMAGATEEEVYAALGLPWIPPELREDRGEIQAAEEGKLPQLIELADLHGDLHVHTLASDGHNTLEEMAAAAAERGYQYLGIAEHSPALLVVHGLNAEEIRQHRQAVDELNRKLKKQGGKLQVLLGTEADILADGSLDLPEEAAELFEFVIGAIHQGFSSDADKMTRRIIRAIESGRMDILAHPTGRLLLEREAYGIHLEQVIAAAAEAQMAIEINASPHRLDLDEVHCCLAQEQGVLLCINTDAHSVDRLDEMRYGVTVARRGWIEASTVINTWPLRKLRQWLTGRRK